MGRHLGLHALFVLVVLTAGAAVGLPSVTWVRAVPSGRILSSRVLKQLLVFWATTKRIQPSLDQASLPRAWSSKAPLSRWGCVAKIKERTRIGLDGDRGMEFRRRGRTPGR